MSLIPDESSTATRLTPGGFRFCLRHPALLARWFVSRRFRHAVEVRKHIWKIRSFQADELSPAALSGIDAGIATFDALLRANAPSAKLAGGLDALENCAQKWLQPYANASMRENVEVFLVAIGVAMAIRTFFLQPFKIPTGSMQPTLYGVHFEDLRNRADEKIPSLPGRIAAALLRGEYYHEIVAEADGVVAGVLPRKTIALVGYQDVLLRYSEGGRTRDKKHRVWFAPMDGHGGDLRGLQSVLNWNQPQPFYPVMPGKTFRKGEVLLRLKDSAGDHLFVDRLTYNFRPPKRGEIIVFETRGTRIRQQDQFYIKRLVALGGEKVRLGDDRHLVINDVRLDASTPHFEKVYSFNGPAADSQYSGHVNDKVAETYNRRGLAPEFPDGDAEFQVPRGRCMVMGDNTLNSLDSRAWGHFAQTNTVGRYCFVWWPFTARWGTRAD